MGLHIVTLEEFHIFLNAGLSSNWPNGFMAASGWTTLKESKRRRPLSWKIRATQRVPRRRWSTKNWRLETKRANTVMGRFGRETPGGPDLQGQLRHRLLRPRHPPEQPQMQRQASLASRATWRQVWNGYETSDDAFNELSETSPVKDVYEMLKAMADTTEVSDIWRGFCRVVSGV